MEINKEQNIIPLGETDFRVDEGKYVFMNINSWLYDVNVYYKDIKIGTVQIRKNFISDIKLSLSSQKYGNENDYNDFFEQNLDLKEKLINDARINFNKNKMNKHNISHCADNKLLNISSGSILLRKYTKNEICKLHYRLQNNMITGNRINNSIDNNRYNYTAEDSFSSILLSIATFVTIGGGALYFFS
jgi:hypothetical protein